MKKTFILCAALVLLSASSGLAQTTEHLKKSKLDDSGRVFIASAEGIIYPNGLFVIQIRGEGLGGMEKTPVVTLGHRDADIELHVPHAIIATLTLPPKPGEYILTVSNSIGITKFKLRVRVHKRVAVVKAEAKNELFS